MMILRQQVLPQLYMYKCNDKQEISLYDWPVVVDVEDFDGSHDAVFDDCDDINVGLTTIDPLSIEWIPNKIEVWISIIIYYDNLYRCWRMW